MSIRRRLNWLEDRVDHHDERPMIVILDGTEKSELLGEARAYGGPLNIIRIGRSEMVACQEAADARMAELGAEKPRIPITIVGPDGVELASWDPGLPRGLKGRGTGSRRGSRSDLGEGEDASDS